MEREDRIYTPQIVRAGTGWDQPLQQQCLTGFKRLRKTDTVKRPRPPDLFENGTRLYSERSYQVIVSPGHWRNLYGVIGWEWNLPGVTDDGSTIGPSTTVIPPDPCDTQTRLKIKNQKVNLSVSFAELPKTADMVTGFFTESLGFLRSLRRGDLVRAVNAFSKPRSRADRALAGKWLEFQYGWVPTMFEVQGALELLQQRIIHGYITTEVRHTSGTSISGTTFFPFEGERVQSRKNIVRYKVSQDAFRTLAQTGITNPALVVWELIPYSFVVDWFVSVGDYLASLDALVGVQDLTVIRSMKEVVTLRCQRNDGWQEPQRFTQTSDRRLRLPPTTDLPLARPKYEPHLSITRMVSASALIRNLFK